MKRGEMYRVAHASVQDPKKQRVFVVVSRQILIDSRFSTVICAPVYTAYDGLATQIPVGTDEGLKHLVLPKLAFLTLRDTGVTKDGRTRFSEILPWCALD